MGRNVSLPWEERGVTHTHLHTHTHTYRHNRRADTFPRTNCELIQKKKHGIANPPIRFIGCVIGLTRILGDSPCTPHPPPPLPLPHDAFTSRCGTYQTHLALRLACVCALYETTLQKKNKKNTQKMSKNFTCGLGIYTYGAECSGNGRCVFDSILNRGVCVCNAGFNGEADFRGEF